MAQNKEAVSGLMPAALIPAEGKHGLDFIRRPRQEMDIEYLCEFFLDLGECVAGESGFLRYVHAHVMQAS